MTTAPEAGRTQPAVPRRLELRAGLVGLPELRSFDVRPVGPDGLLELLSLDDPAFGFAATDCELVRPGLTAQVVEATQAAPEASVLVLLAAHGEPPTVTANLAGPIVVMPDGTAQQVVLEGPSFPLRAPVAAIG